MNFTRNQIIIAVLLAIALFFLVLPNATQVAYLPVQVTRYAPSTTRQIIGVCALIGGLYLLKEHFEKDEDSESFENNNPYDFPVFISKYRPPRF